jgi:hypothetical protein
VANPQYRLLWWALVVALLVYVVMAHIVEVPPSPDLPLELLTGIFASLSLVLGVGSLILRRRALSSPIQSGRLDPSTPEGLQRATPPFILSLVLSESVGIYGLLLSLLSGNPFYSVVFAGAALVLMFLHRPTAPDLVPPLSARLRGEDSSPIG